jgi:hypothetical protein
VDRAGHLAGGAGGHLGLFQLPQEHQPQRHAGQGTAFQSQIVQTSGRLDGLLPTVQRLSDVEALHLSQSQRGSGHERAASRRLQISLLQMSEDFLQKERVAMCHMLEPGYQLTGGAPPDPGPG